VYRRSTSGERNTFGGKTIRLSAVTYPDAPLGPVVIPLPLLQRRYFPRINLFYIAPLDSHSVVAVVAKTRSPTPVAWNPQTDYSILQATNMSSTTTGSATPLGSPTTTSYTGTSVSSAAASTSTSSSNNDVSSPGTFYKNVSSPFWPFYPFCLDALRTEWMLTFPSSSISS